MVAWILNSNIRYDEEERKKKTGHQLHTVFA